MIENQQNANVSINKSIVAAFTLCVTLTNGVQKQVETALKSANFTTHLIKSAPMSQISQN